MRLDKFISQATDLTRSLARQVVKQNRVCINDQLVHTVTQVVLATDRITLDGNLLSLPGNRYIMLHKPTGYVCTRGDTHHADVFSLVDRSDDLHVAGRLDADTTGLVLLTNDGQWSHRVTSPRRKCDKVYLVGLAHALDNAQITRIEQGVALNGEDKPTLPAQLKLISDTHVELTIHEGKYHQVKRMFAAVGNLVVALHRQSIGQVVLGGGLLPGEWRNLTSAEYENF